MEAYVSPTAQTYGRNHSALGLELVVMAFALKVYKHCLYRVPYDVYTGHPLKLALFSKV